MEGKFIKPKLSSPGVLGYFGGGNIDFKRLYFVFNLNILQEMLM